MQHMIYFVQPQTSIMCTSSQLSALAMATYMCRGVSYILQLNLSCHIHAGSCMEPILAETLFIYSHNIPV